MLLFAHRGHSYEDRATRQLYMIVQGTYREVPDPIGLLLLNAHPDKLCDVTGEADPGKHICPKTGSGDYEHAMVQSPPLTTELRPKLSRQKREMRRNAKKRSLRARLVGKTPWVTKTAP